MVWLGRLGLQKKIFIYIGAGLLILMSLLTWFSLQTINQAIDMVRQGRLALVENIALDIDEVIEHLRAEIVDAALALGQRWDNEPIDSQQEHLASVREHLRQHLLSFHQIEQAVFVALLDAQGKVLWTEPYLAQKVNQSLADTAAVQEAVKRRQVYIEVEEALLTGDSPTLSLVAPIKDDQGEVRGMLIVDMPTLPSNSGFIFFLARWGDDDA